MLTIHDAVLRHQVFLEGLKSGELQNFQTTLAAISADVQKRLRGLSFETMDQMTKRALAELLADVKGIALTHYNKYVAAFVLFLQDFMRVDRKLTIDVYGHFADPATKPESDDDYPLVPLLWGRAKNAPIPANGIPMLDFIAALSGVGALALMNRIRQAYANRETINETIIAIVGTRDLRFRDGLLNRQSNSARAVISTTVQHIRAINEAAIGAILWREYDWLSVIDNATTIICRLRNGNRYRYGFGPLPPAHVGCRSTAVPVLPGQPDAPRGFRSWAMSQPFALRRSMFGSADPGEHFEGSPPLTLARYRDKRDDILADG